MHNAYRLVQTVLGPCPHIAPTVYAAGFMRTFLQTFSAADFYTCSRQAPYSAGLSRPDVTPEPARYNINLCQRFVTPDVLPTYADEQTRPFIPSGRHGFLSAPTAARAQPCRTLTTLASHCIHYAMSTRFSLPCTGLCKKFLQYHRVFFIFSAQRSTPSAGVERLPIPFLRKHQQNTPPLGFVRHGNAKPLASGIGFMNFKDQSQRPHTSTAPINFKHHARKLRHHRFFAFQH